MTEPRGGPGRPGAGAAGRPANPGAALRGLALALLLPALPGSAGAATRHVQATLLAGTAQPVAALADYQWDVRPRAAWGAQLMTGTGRMAAGLRWWRASSMQPLGLAGVQDPAVHTGSLELVARARVAQWRTAQLLATASGGRLAITYHPDRLSVVTGGTPVTVALAPLREWVAGAGAALELPFAGGWSMGLEVERRTFALDTAHRSGSAVTLARDRFGDWNARAAVARAWDW